MTDANVEHYGLQVVFDSNGLDPNDTYPFAVIVERKLFFRAMACVSREYMRPPSHGIDRTGARSGGL